MSKGGTPKIWNLEHQLIGRSTWYFDEVESTSNFALTFASDERNNGIAIFADEQKAGRGQYGRVWTAAKGQAVLLSVLLFPPPFLNRPALLTAWVAVAVCTTIENFLGIRAAIKWPNDILVDRKKISGILIEQTKGTVVGIGLNVLQASHEFAIEGLPLATSMQQFSPHPLNTHEVAKQLLANLDEDYQLLLLGLKQKLERDWVRGIGLLGKEVQLEEQGKKHRGRLLKQSFESLEIETSLGIKLSFVPENIRHLEELINYAEGQP